LTTRTWVYSVKTGNRCLDIFLPIAVNIRYLRISTIFRSIGFFSRIFQRIIIARSCYQSKSCGISTETRRTNLSNEMYHVLFNDPLLRLLKIILYQYQPLQLRLPAWHLSSGSSPSAPSNPTLTPASLNSPSLYT
jgi:hypothetical protein